MARLASEARSAGLSAGAGSSAGLSPSSSSENELSPSVIMRLCCCSSLRSCSAALRLSPTVACALPSGTDVLIPAAPSWGLTGAGRNMNHSTTKKMHPRIAVKSSTLRLRCRSNSAEGSLHGFLFSVIMVYGLRCNNSGCPISNSDPMSAANRSQR